jgi:methylmalonyl-CoA mutase
MSQPPVNQNLANSRAAWEARVKAALPQGTSLAELSSLTFEGLAVEPLYCPRRDAAPLLRARSGWEIAQRLDHPDPRLANAQALEDLENGAQSLAIVVADAEAARGFGLASSQICRALEGIDLALVSVRLDAGAGAAAAGEALRSLIGQRGIDPGSTAIDFALDPIGTFAACGRWPIQEAELAQQLSKAAGQMREAGYPGTSLLADGRVYHEAGCGEAQELGFVIATAVHYLRLLESHDWPLDAAARQISFLMAADAAEFLTLAKFRALRRLWASVEQHCGLVARTPRVHAETAWRMMAGRDPWTNVLRTTLASFAAVAGGADVVTVLPCSLACGLPDARARRLARNTQLILQHESHLDKVADPAAGSGAFEGLTDEMCHRAWSIFAEIERQGGMVAALQSGHVRHAIEPTRAARDTALARRTLPLTGVSEFVDLEGPSMPVVIPAPAPARRSAASLPARRDGEPFEHLRAAADAFAQASGNPPRIYLACLGRPASFMARATFAKNFFEVGGIEAVLGEVPRAAQVGAAFRRAQAQFACLCASDAAYADEAAGFAAALKEAGAVHLYLAGRPANQADLRAAGVDTFIALGDDVLATLAGAHAMLHGRAKAS